MPNDYQYDVAISFAEEDRNAALALALAFELRGIVPYYYPDNKAETLGNIKQNLHRLYCNEARFAIVLLSDHYLNVNKEYVPIEMEAIQKRMHEEKALQYMIPVRLDKKTEIQNTPWFKDQLILEWEYKPKEIAGLVWQLLGKKKQNNLVGPLTTEQIYNMIDLINNGPVNNQVITINSNVNLP